MDELVRSVLKEAEERNAGLPGTDVPGRPLDQEVDLGNLLAIEVNDYVLPKSPLAFEKFLKDRARENCQLLFNAIWELPTEKVEEVIVAKLPPPSTLLPREKVVPKAKPLTKWQKYAKDKNIVKKKKTNLVWDDVVKEWVPRFGYKKAQAELKKNWMMEYKGNADPSEDPFEKAAKEKQEKVAKNELQRLRNIARTKNVKVPSVGVLPPVPSAGVRTTSDDMSKAADLAFKSTASLGKFQERSSGKLEKGAKTVKGRKRKFESNTGDAAGEKAKNLAILENMGSKAPKLNLNKAVGAKLHQEDSQRSEEKQNKGGKKGRGGPKGQGKKGKGGGGGSFSGKKVKGGGGERKGKGKKGGGGTKRR